MNVLSESLLRVRQGNRFIGAYSLPSVLAALVRDEIEDVPALRPHQRHPWHAFTVQLAALALHRAAMAEPPADEVAWAALLRALTPEWPDDAPWCLVSPPDRPALLQPPVPGRALTDFKGVVSTPDALDMLVTSKNHDLKAAVMTDARPEDWLFALISLQTMDGFMGAGNYGISRMNGGFASRPGLGVVPVASEDAPGAAPRPGARFVRDLRILLRGRDTILQHNDLKPNGGLGLLWVQPWDGADQLRFSDLDPFYIEVCRRVRLEERGGGLVAQTAGSKKARIAAADLKGRTGDPWTPIELMDVSDKAWPAPKALSITGDGFSYQKMTELLLKKRYRPALAQEITEDDGDEGLAIAACGLARGQGKTDGYHERIVPVSKQVIRMFRARATDQLAGWAEERVKEAGVLRGRILRPALFSLLQDGPEQVNFRAAETAAQADRFLDRLDRAFDATFFDDLWAEAEQAEAGDAARETIRHQWQRRFVEFARDLLIEAADAVPHASMRRYRARVRGDATFYGALYKIWPHLRPAKESERDDA